MDFDQLKQAQGRMWGSGPFEEIETNLADMHDALVASIGPSPNEEWLDLGCGTGAVASRAAKFPDHHRGLLHGLSVWAVAFVIAILVAGSSAAGGFVSAVGGVAERADPADAALVDRYYDPAVGPVAADPAQAGAPAVPVPAQPVVEDAADATGQVALWAFLTMLLGGVAAVLGARYGVRRHGWELKANVTDGGAIHTPATAGKAASPFAP